MNRQMIFTLAIVAILLAIICYTNTYSAAPDETYSHADTVGSTLVVSQNHPRADDSNPGTEEAPFETISRAAELAQPGDTVLVHAGVYRERVFLLVAHWQLPVHLLSSTLSLGIRLFCSGPIVA